jgi:hypothetical protein
MISSKETIEHMREVIKPYASSYIAQFSLGLSVQTVNNFRKSKTEPSMETILGITEFIGYRKAYVEFVYDICLDEYSKRKERIGMEYAAQGRISPIEE